jgi:spore maturation protein SpmA
MFSKNKTVKFSGVQNLMDCCLPKSTLLDLVLPLMAYLFLFWLMEFNYFSVCEENAKALSPVLSKYFQYPKNHPSISYMTLNFAANFSRTRFGCNAFVFKAMESLQEINPEKTKLVTLKSCSCVCMLGTYVDCYFYYWYRAAANASNPADVMLPCIITSFIGTIAAF